MLASEPLVVVSVNSQLDRTCNHQEGGPEGMSIGNYFSYIHGFGNTCLNCGRDHYLGSESWIVQEGGNEVNKGLFIHALF